MTFYDEIEQTNSKAVDSSCENVCDCTSHTVYQ